MTAATKTVSIVEYHDGWPEDFHKAAAELTTAFADLAVAVEHIGSTSVPGLCAKPVIDIMLGVQQLSQADLRIAALAELGYRYRPEYETQLPDRRYFVRQAGEIPRIHLHTVITGGLLWRRHLAFRDALRGNPQISRQYGDLKRRLAVSHADDRAAYSAAKAPFIEQILAGARE